MKIAVFLDVDMTLTTDYIQHIYAEQLGVANDYQELEAAFQRGLNNDPLGISSSEFGTKLSKLFASKDFSKSKAEELFNKIPLAEHLDELFKWQEKGVCIYLVSSGPNYYIDVLAARNKIPLERTMSSTYHFGGDGIVLRCDAVNAQDKHRFVEKETAKYDLTIGVGDNFVHDAFVSLCTIAMFKKPHKDYIHLTQFSSVSRIIDRLLEVEESDLSLGIIAVDDLRKGTLKNFFKTFSVGIWIAFATIVGASFYGGMQAQSFLGSHGSASAKAAP